MIFFAFEFLTDQQAAALDFRTFVYPDRFFFTPFPPDVLI